MQDRQSQIHLLSGLGLQYRGYCGKSVCGGWQKVLGTTNVDLTDARRGGGVVENRG